MKYLLTLAIGIMICFNSFEQTAESNEYYDAIRLKSYINSRGDFASNSVDDKYYDILLKYSPQHKNETEDSLKSYYKNTNTFLSGYINPTVGMSPTNLSSRAGGFSGFASIGSTDITMYADAMAQFMIKRAQAELTVAFFERFKKFTEEHKEIKILFPKTCDRIDNLFSVNYRQMLTVLREAFQEDLNALPEHLFEVVEGYAEDHNILELSLSIRTLKQVKKLDYLSPSEFINQMPEITSDIVASSPTWYKNLNASFQLTALFSNSIQDTTENKNWVSSKDFYRNILSDPITKEIFIGLLYQNIKNKAIGFNGTLLATSIDTSDIKWFSSQFTELINLTEKVQSTVFQISALHKNSTAASQSQVHAYITTTLEIAEFGNGIFDKFGNGTDEFEQYLSMVEQANDIYRYTYEKQYGSAIMESVNLLKDVYAKIKPNQISKINGLLTATKDSEANLRMVSGKLEIKSGSSASPLTSEKIITRKLAEFNELIKGHNLSLSDATKLLKAALKKEKTQFEKNNPWVDKIMTYGVFMANMIEAKSTEDVMAIIESVVLPVGSSALRKNSTFSMNVTSYLGAGVRQQGVWKPSLTAPIGVDMGWGFNRGGSVSINASIIDLGAIVDYRLSNDSSEIVSQITLGNIVSPGIHLVYGLPFNIPIAIGFGGKFGPGLTGISTEGLSISNKPNWHLNAFLAVDMPLLNLYNRSRKKL
jgi:hypothetical protein